MVVTLQGPIHRVLIEYDEYSELIDALKFYADHSNWVDHAEEVMEPEDAPSWVAEVELPGYLLLEYGNYDGWTTAEDVLKKFNLI
jgi:hypothetical protein